MAEDEMVEWHHRLDEHEFEQAPRVGDGQGSLACCSPWGYGHDLIIEQQQDFGGLVCVLSPPSSLN